MTEPLLIYTHVPKAAGSTLAAFLRRQYRRNEIMDVMLVPRAEIPERVANLPENIKLVIGHARYGLHRHTQRPCRYFTLLREPMERVLSAYYFVRRMPSHWLHATAIGSGGLAAFARQQLNIQTKFIAGTGPEKEADAADLAQARENLAQHYAMAGLAERFDESLLLCAETFGWKIAPYVPRNVTPERPTRERHTEAELAAVRETNALDLDLYAAAEALLRQRLAAQPAAFSSRLAAFRRTLRRHAWRQTMSERVRALWAEGRGARPNG